MFPLLVVAVAYVDDGLDDSDDGVDNSHEAAGDGRDQGVELEYVSGLAVVGRVAQD